MSKFRHHKYTFSRPFGSGRHVWQVVGPVGAVHFHASMPVGQMHEAACGLEFHHTRASGVHPDEAPHFTRCEITGEPCWHDGTSLYASETLWPKIKPCLESGNHDAVFTLLEAEYESRFERTDD